MYLPSLLFFCVIVLSLTYDTDNYGCPDSTYNYKEINGTRKCYKVYTASQRPDRCKLIDYCRPLHPNAIPTTIKSIEEREYLKTISQSYHWVLLGVYIPCGREDDSKDFVNVDDTPIPAPLERYTGWGREFLAMVAYGMITDDLYEGDETFKNIVMCAITLPPSPCPDGSYVYNEINDIGKCYKVYTAPYETIDRCNLINACRNLYPDAIPATISSIEEREYLKTLVNPYEYTVIGVSIPCPLPYNVNSYKNVDGTSLPAPLEVTTGMWPDQFVGMLFQNKTDNLDLRDTEFQQKILCSIPIYYECPEGTYPDSYNGVATRNTTCVKVVPYVPSETKPEDVCKSLDQTSTPSSMICSVPQTVSHKQPAPLPYCNI